MFEKNTQRETLLLDMHLGRLESAEADVVRKAVAASPELTAQDRNLRQLRGLLDRFDVPEPPRNLADMVMSRIKTQTAVLPFERAASAIPAGTGGNLFATPVLTLRELIAIAACITLIVGIFVPGYFKARNLAYRSYCMNNQRQIWQGMSNYVQANNGYMAWAGYVPNAYWLPNKAPNVQRVSNTRPVFKLPQGGYVPHAKVFICPADKQARPMLADNYRLFTDFAEPANNSYSYQCFNIPRARLLEDKNPRMALLADRNPLFDSRAAHLLSPYGEDIINSAAHGDAAGQNVIHLDGQGFWYDRPAIGVDNDNIYRSGGIVRHEGNEEPAGETDTFLIP